MSDLQMVDHAQKPPTIHWDFTQSEIEERDKTNKIFGFVLGVCCTIVAIAVISVFVSA